MGKQKEASMVYRVFQDSQSLKKKVDCNYFVNKECQIPLKSIKRY